MKTISRFVGVAMVLGLFAGAVAPAQAATVAELQAMIAQLTAQLSQLAGTSSTTTTTTTTSTTFTTDLTVGSRGAQVVALQNWLIAKGYLAAGNNTGYFGGLTQAAVAKWQLAAGITPAAGYFGPKSRAAANASATASTGTTTTTGGTTTTTTTSTLSGGDGDFADFDVLSTPNNQNIAEGDEEKVLTFEFDAEDSDLRVERVNLVFSSTSRPWDSFASVKLFLGDKEIASMDADTKSDWDEDNDDYSISFGDLSVVVKEDDTARFHVVVEAQDDIDADDRGSWTVTLDGNDAVRAENAEGINVYEGPTSLTSDDRAFEFEAIQTDINITVDGDDNEDMTVDVSEDDETNDVTLYTASFESQEGENTITEVQVNLASSTGANLSTIITTLYLFIDGEEVGSESVNGNGIVSFEDFDDITVKEDDEVSIVVKADIAESDDFTSGQSVYVTSIAVTSEDANDDETTTTETTDGGTITFSDDALTVTEATAAKTAEFTNDDSSKGTYEIEFKVTAPEDEEIYIDVDAGTTTASTTGARYQILNASGVEYYATSTSGYLTLVGGNGDDDDAVGYIHIEDGDTATLKLTVYISNTGAATAQDLRVGLIAVNYLVGSTNVTSQAYTAGLDSDFRTGTLHLTTTDLSN